MLRRVHLRFLQAALWGGAWCIGICETLHAFTEDPARLIRNTEPRTPEGEQKGFHLPEGFEVQLFADDAQLGGKPINMAFDARGRLWVTSTQEYPYAVKKEKWSADSTRAAGSKDSIRILEDTDGDGRADKVTVFADDLNIPTGVLPYKNGCIAWSIPNLLFLEDTQHAGRAEHADQRRILFGPLGYERDTHGMISSLRLGLDGWVYATHGFSNTSHFQVLPQNRSANTAANSEVLDISSGSVFRFRPDGSAVQLWTCGQVNPFGLCWDSWGNLYSADCHSNPITQLIRGATYPQFGKTTDPLGFGPVMCEHAHGSTGIAGIVYVDGGLWGSEWNDHMFVGNPVTSKVNHDHITFTGSSPRANEQPDFLVSDDPWFRPVDLQMGPDGALYIADFYNRIIGHYEIPLDHPGRDRKSGRIWRIVKRGLTRSQCECDLSGKTAEELRTIVREHPNVNTRHAAWGELIRRDRFEATDAAHRPPVDVTVSSSLILPVGAAHENAERSKLQAARETAAEMLDTPRLEMMSTLAEQLNGAALQDEHLKQALRIGLRSILQSPGAYQVLASLKAAHAIQNELIRIALAIPSETSADWLLSRITEASQQGQPVENAVFGKCLSHIARYLPVEREAELLKLVQGNFAHDLDTQLDLFFAVQKGEQERKQSEPDAVMRKWAGELDLMLLQALAKDVPQEWSVSTPPSSDNPSPWFATKRKCADGVEADFLDSHPPGGEKLTGGLRSKSFPMPQTLTFWIAGHRGYPNTAAHELNWVRLVDASTGREISRMYPPRHDVAQEVIWQCGGAAAEENPGATGDAKAKHAAPQVLPLASDLAGRAVRVEVMDGDSGSAYAWLALGRFTPPVLTTTNLKSGQRDKRVLALAKLCAPGVLPEADAPRLRAASQETLASLPDKAAQSAETRLALVEATASRHPDPLARLLTPLVKDPALAEPWLELLTNPQSDLTPELAKIFKSATFRQQAALAELLAATREGAGPLLTLAPPSVLAEPLVSSKIKALGDEALTEKLAKLIAALPPPNAAVNALISQRLKSFDPSTADEKRGQQVFAQTCTPCHRIGITGNLVGPQLDGIGVRGAERLLEDILDPNREVDPAFRLHILKLKDGSVTTGLVRREQDGALVYADVVGQEHSVPRAEVTADEVSPFSLMPSGFGEVLTEAQLHDLLRYLLERK